MFGCIWKIFSPLVHAGFFHARRKTPLFLAGVIGLALIGCAENRQYTRVGPPSDKKRLVLPEGGRYSKLNPYEINGEIYYPLADAEGFVEEGKASWYGEAFHSRPTANGEIYNMYQKSAAHKILPLGTYVKVVNLTNGKETVLRINDRGPFVKGRIIDLSYGAAKEIGLVGPGVADVRVIALGKEVGKLESPAGPRPIVEIDNLSRGDFTVQVGAFRERERAFRLADKLKAVFRTVDVAVHEAGGRKVLYRVRVSNLDTLARASEVEKKLEEMGYTEAFIVSL